jgi:hypothetical protein
VEALAAQTTAEVAQQTGIGKPSPQRDLQKIAEGHVGLTPRNDLPIRKLVVIAEVQQLQHHQGRLRRPSSVATVVLGQHILKVSPVNDSQGFSQNMRRRHHHPENLMVKRRRFCW